MANMTVDVVIVTYNRLEKLKKAIACYDSQTKGFRNMIVVNNHSTDGTTDYLEEWKDKDAPYSKYVINTNDNLGGSGGYYLGQKKALDLGAEWIFLADDDAYAATDMMELFYDYASRHSSEKISAICGTVYHSDGTIDMNHRSRYELKNRRFFFRLPSTDEDYQKDEFGIDFLSYVGSFIKREAMEKAGLVDPRFFIFWDDSEHSIRLKKYGKLICVPSIKVIHDDLPVSPSKQDKPNVTWKDYYYERNETVLFIKHFPLVALHQLRIFLKKKHTGFYSTDFGRIKIDAMHDAWLGCMGRHKLYKPGWTNSNQ